MRTLRVLYDHQIFSLQRFGGISKYFTQIIEKLPDSIQPVLPVKYTHNNYLQFNHLFKNIEKSDFFQRIISTYDFKGKNRILKIINEKFSTDLLRQQNFDIFHPTYYDDYFLNYIGDKPFVLTIHDMIPEKFPDLNTRNELAKKKSLLATNAKHIIAVSENTKTDIIDILGINEKKISVVYHASSLTKGNNVDTPVFLGDYILFVGERQHYKNFTFFVQAIKAVLFERKNLKVICSGKDFNKEELNLIADLNLSDRFSSVFVTENQMYNLYHHAKVLVFPSSYEGFGIPIIEAFDAECPVILSNSSCFPEIGGDSAIYFEPKNADQLVHAVEEILDDKELCIAMINKGKKRQENFSWEKAAFKTSEIYHQYAKSPS